MPQHINLLHPGLLPRREAFDSAHAAWAVAGVLACALLATSGLRLRAGSRTEQALAAEQQRVDLQARVDAVGGTPPAPRHAAELQRLQAVDAGQRQVRVALDSGAAGRAQGYAEYFMALSRQAQPSLWITGFTVAADGLALELRGRMLDPHLLPQYLRQLNSEPLFKGREFAQMQLKSVEPGTAGGAGITEFSLRALPAARATAGTPP